MFTTAVVNAKGKVVKVYKHADVKIPLEALVKFKKQTMLINLLAQAKQQTDLVAAQKMQHAKRELFASFVKQKQRA